MNTAGVRQPEDLAPDSLNYGSQGRKRLRPKLGDTVLDSYTTTLIDRVAK